MEIWKDIPNYEGLYQASNLGRIRSVDKELKCGKYTRKYKSKILKTRPDKDGYLKIDIIKNRKRKTFRVHQLIAITFLSHKPCGHKLVINHIDFNRVNNNVDNLEVITQRENANLKHIQSTSRYIGVAWHKSLNKWRAKIVINGKSNHLGYFRNEKYASLSYQLALSKLKQIS